MLGKINHHCFYFSSNSSKFQLGFIYIGLTFWMPSQRWEIQQTTIFVWVFDVRSFYKSLSSSNIDEFPWECILCGKVPKQVSFFLWTIVNDEIFTIDNIVKRGQSLVNRCCLCYCDGESVDHLLLHCKFSHTLWCKIFAEFGIQQVMPRSVSYFFFIWRKWFGKHFSTIWNMVSTCLMWLVWQERNTHIFKDKERTLDHLISLLFGTLFHWARIWGCTNCISLTEFSVSICFSS